MTSIPGWRTVDAPEEKVNTTPEHAHAGALGNARRMRFLLVIGSLFVLATRASLSREMEATSLRAASRAGAPIVVHAVAFGITPALRDLPPEKEIPLEERNALPMTAIEVEPFPGVEAGEMI